MRVLIDACVLFPTVMREVVLGVAAQGLFEPRWSDRILEEWARATPKLGDGAEAVARGEIALLSARFPRAIVPVAPHVEQRLWLSDENDIHVLASAIAGSCDAILTINAKDFPKHVLAEEGLSRLDPDGFLYSLWLDHPAQVQAAADAVLAEARRLSVDDWTMRSLMKKARLPRLGKALD
ncbi:RSP_2648 family PIN domain-containing protein [Marivivens donghaensis]|uniref:RSP_2648 family PIN domain-containing protein n=1 Tax=Marivivens donghaensis TaxID=1699413 RepID=UPI003F69F64D